VCQRKEDEKRMREQITQCIEKSDPLSYCAVHECKEKQPLEGYIGVKRMTNDTNKVLVTKIVYLAVGSAVLSKLRFPEVVDLGESKTALSG
jgi:hypothetical protein